MPCKTETLVSILKDVQDMYATGNTGKAMDQVNLVTAEALIVIANHLSDIELHLEAIANPFKQAQEPPINLEAITNAASKRKAKAQGG